jgi:hypothetical protein
MGLRQGAMSDRRRSRQCGRLTALRLAWLVWPAAGIAMLLAPPAWAGQVSVVDQQLTFIASPGERNVVVVAPAALGYQVSDDGAPLLAGSGCNPVDDGQVVRCNQMVLEIRVDAGDRGDTVIARRVVAPVTASGGAGTDLVVGGGGADDLHGDEGLDTLMGAGSNDSADGGVGDDLLLGGPAEDTLLGAEGADIVEGGLGDDKELHGGPGEDLMLGGEGQDDLKGNDDDDVLIGGPEVDAVTTNSGMDLVFAAEDETDVVKCVEADDQVRGRARWVGDSCPAPPASTRRPSRWPPRRAQATIPPQKPEVTVRPVRRGHASVTIVRVKTPFSELKRARIRVRLFARKGRLLDDFKPRVKTRHKVPLKKKPPRKAHHGEGQCCFG